MKDWVLALCVALLAVLAYRRWEMLTATAAVAPTPAPLVARETKGAPAVSHAVPPTPVSTPAVVAPEAGFAARVADSRRRAVAKYPELGMGGSPLNRRFVARYQQLAAAGSPLLRDSDWPVHLADDCAAGPSPVGSPPPAAVRPAGS